VFYSNSPSINILYICLFNVLINITSGNQVLKKFSGKKVIGEHITAKKAVNQRQQMRFRIIASNAYRKTILVLTKHFYAAIEGESLKTIKDIKNGFETHYN